MSTPDFHIRISTQAQTLTLLRLAPEALEGGLRWAPDAPGTVLMHVLVSTSKNGVGQQQGSYQTPQGRHRIRAKIGTGAAFNCGSARSTPCGVTSICMAVRIAW